MTILRPGSNVDPNKMLGETTEVSKYFGLEDLDRRISEFVAGRTGFFVELGAADGIEQNNTLYLERLGWRGVLIEPVSWQYDACVRNRPLAKVFNCACVPFGAEGAIEMISMQLMSTIKGALGDREGEWIELASSYGHVPENVTVRARTLSAVLEEAGTVAVDLLVVDVEGYELKVLEGLDFDRFAPDWLVAEDLYTEDVRDYLVGKGYSLVAQLSARERTRDRIYKRVRTSSASR